MKIWQEWQNKFEAEKAAHESTKKELEGQLSKIKQLREALEQQRQLNREMTEYRDNWRSKALG